MHLSYNLKGEIEFEDELTVFPTEDSFQDSETCILPIFAAESVLAEQKARDKASIAMAIRSLSYSEREAIEHIFDELDADEGLLVASKVADRVGITRSVIVNALRKLESAGVIESRSLGMKGTFIKVKKEDFLPELRKES